MPITFRAHATAHQQHLSTFLHHLTDLLTLSSFLPTDFHCLSTSGVLAAIKTNLAHLLAQNASYDNGTSILVCEFTLSLPAITAAPHVGNLDALTPAQRIDHLVHMNAFFAYVGELHVVIGSWTAECLRRVEARREERQRQRQRQRQRVRRRIAPHVIVSNERLAWQRQGD